MKMKYALVRAKAAAVMAVILTVLSAVLALNVNAAQIIDNGDYIYKLNEDGKTLSIINYKGNSLYLKLPSRVDKYYVTVIESAAFMYNDTIKDLEISETIKEIKSNAFSECKSLKKLTVPENVKVIGDSAFCNCTVLKTVKISEGIQKIGNYCFVGCESLSELTLPQKIDEIGEYAFFGCSELEKIDLPKSFKRFGGYALEGTKWMSNQKSEFVVVGDGLLLKYNGNGDKIVIPDKVKIIGECAFAKNQKIREAEVSKNVSRIEKSAFSECAKLEKIKFNGNVVSIGQSAFKDCVLLDEVKLEKLEKISANCFENCRSMQSVKIPDSVKIIEKGAFKSCYMLQKAEMGKGVEKVEESVFEDCTSLKRLEFFEKLKEISALTCVNCHSLTRVEFHSEVTVPSLAFSDCIHLSEAVFYKTPKNIAINAFNHCSEKFSLYASDTSGVEKFAEKNKYELKGVNQLSLYEDKGILTPDDETEKSVFSGGHTAIIVIILLADCGIVLFFAMYVLLSRTSKRGKKSNDKSDVKAQPRHSKSTQKNKKE